MPPPYQTFQKFNDPDLAAAIAQQLQAKGIDSKIENESPLLDATIIGDSLGSSIHLKIPASQFTRAHAVMEEYYRSQLQNIDPDYYLLSFTNAELLEVVQKPDEWGHLDYALAKRLLNERGQEITPVKADQLRQQRLSELTRPEKAHPIPIIIGYAGTLISLLGGLTGGFFGLWFNAGGLTLGYMLAFLKKTLPNGEKVYIYSPAERGHGKIILALGAIGLIVWFLMLLRPRSE